MGETLLITSHLTPEQSRAVAELYGRALRAGDEAELYNVIATWLPEILPSDRSTITMRVEGTNELEVLGLEGLDGLNPVGWRVPIGDTGIGRTITTGETQHWVATDHPQGLRGIINAPLRNGSEIIGTLNVGRKDGPYHRYQADLMADVADLVSTNLSRFQALAHTRVQLKAAEGQLMRVKILSGLARSLSAAKTEADAIEALFEQVGGLLISGRTTLAVINEAEATFRVAALAETVEDFGPQLGEVVPLANTTVGEVYHAGRTRIHNHAERAPEVAQRLMKASGVESLMSTPVHSSQGLVAVLVFASDKPGTYSDEDITLAEAVAQVLGETLERIRAQEAVAARDRQLAAIVNDSPLMIMTLDEDGTIVRVSEFGATRLGYDPEALQNTRLSDLYPIDEREKVQAEISALGTESEGEVKVWPATTTDAQGNTVHIRHTGRRLRRGGGQEAMVLVCEDITELFQLSDKLRHEASHDPLTGLVNRREFDRKLDELITNRGSDEIGSLCFIDLDKFKAVNDTAGHRAGDALLKEVAAVLDNEVGRDDVIGRIGGDEFAVLLPGVPVEAAEALSTRLLAAIRKLNFHWDEQTFNISLSIGVTAINGDTLCADSVFSRADVACYRAKTSGRNQVAVHPS